MQEEIQDIVSDWSEEPRSSALRLLDYYGNPDEFSKSMFIWYNTFDGWKRTVLSREEIPHNFPSPHIDFLEQFINYRVPLDKYNELARYDGSVIVERTRGEISARCGGTSMNFVAINLAHEIITGKRTVEEARQEYADLYTAYQKGETSPYIKEFQFDVTKEPTGDPDVAVL